MRESIQDAFAALVLNIPFNFSAMVFSNMIENITSKKEAYLMYARFLQMIINSQAPDLPKEESDVIPVQVMNDMTLNRLKSYKSKTGGEPTVRPPVKRLVGHLANPDYVFPGGKRWRHENSTSDVENMMVAEDSEGEKVGDEEVESENVGTSSVAADLGEETQEQPSAQSAPGEVSVSRKKRLRSEGSSSRSVAEFMSKKMARKRRKFVYKALPGPAPESQTQTTQPPPAQASIPVQPSSSTVPESGSTPVVSADQINVLNNLVMRLINDQREQADQMKLMMEENQRLKEGQASKDAVIEAQQGAIEGLTKMVHEQASQIATQQRMLLSTSTQLSEFQDEYKTFQASLDIRGDGVLRIKDKDDDEDETDSDKDDEAEPSKPKEG